MTSHQVVFIKELEKPIPKKIKSYSMMNFRNSLISTLLVLTSSHAGAALLDFESAAGYSVFNVGPEVAGLAGTVGVDVTAYNAGSGTNTFTNIPDNTGKFRNIAGAGTKGAIVGATGTGDTTYLTAHSTAQTAGANRPAGFVVGNQLLAFRTENGPFTDPRPGSRNAEYTYAVDSLDLGGNDPAMIGNSVIGVSFYTCVSVSQTSDPGGMGTLMSTVNNANFRGLEMGFGGTATNQAARIGWTDENNLAYFNGAAWVETALTFDYQGFDQVILAIDAGADTWSLQVRRSLNGYNLETVFTNLALENNLANSFGVIDFKAIEDLDGAGATDNNGLAKTYFDSFNFTVNPSPSPVPEPASVLLSLLGICGFAARRRR